MVIFLLSHRSLQLSENSRLFAQNAATQLSEYNFGDFVTLEVDAQNKLFGNWTESIGYIVNRHWKSNKVHKTFSHIKVCFGILDVHIIFTSLMVFTILHNIVPEIPHLQENNHNRKSNVLILHYESRHENLYLSLCFNILYM